MKAKLQPQCLLRDLGAVGGGGGSQEGQLLSAAAPSAIGGAGVSAPALARLGEWAHPKPNAFLFP